MIDRLDDFLPLVVIMILAAVGWIRQLMSQNQEGNQPDGKPRRPLQDMLEEIRREAAGEPPREQEPPRRKAEEPPPLIRQAEEPPVILQEPPPPPPPRPRTNRPPPASRPTPAWRSTSQTDELGTRILSRPDPGHRIENMPHAEPLTARAPREQAKRRRKRGKAAASDGPIAGMDLRQAVIAQTVLGAPRSRTPWSPGSR